ncbi:hypothetical protein RBSWK_04786 [Rhodopirellula baltica SWK14]|uniref:Uncharacterized protein n=1 Tax=Rhodopirellula baltica SWK14 TaxID=993516 RepID=L7CE07_RHOBT|nr:hypothetical protein RBSWK_04786 [Rhodopirellula baltica SWK14]
MVGSGSKPTNHSIQPFQRRKSASPFFRITNQTARRWSLSIY